MNYVHKAYRDKALWYALLSRFVGLVLGPLIVLFVGTYLSPNQQGVYYTFGSLLQLRVIIDLGFSQSAQQILSHAFGDLKIGRREGITGESQRASHYLGTSRFVLQAYVLIAVLTFLLLGIGGYVYLAHSLGDQNLSWEGPWWSMMLSLSLGIGSLGLLNIAESANQLAMTNKWRFAAEMAGISAFLLVLRSGGGLWASAAMAWGRFLLIILPVSIEIGGTTLRQVVSAGSRAVDFRRDILPLQFRNMIVFGAGFLCFYIYNPIALALCGPVVTGILGMSLQLSTMVCGLATVWFNTKIPLMGNLAGSDRSSDLRMLHHKATWVTVINWLILAVAAWFSLIAAKALWPHFGQRFGSIMEMGVFLLGTGGVVWTHVRASYIRAHRVEPFASLSVVQGVGTLVSLYLLLPVLGVMGAAICYAMQMIGGAFWVEVVFRRYRSRMQACL